MSEIIQQLQDQLKGNDFLSGGVILMFVGIMAFYFQKITIRLYEFIKKRYNLLTDNSTSKSRPKLKKINANDILHINDFKDGFIVYLTGLLESRGRIQGTSTDFRQMDRLTSGIKGGELIILAGRPGIGKSTLALNIAFNVATKDKKAVLYYSLGMEKFEMMMRFICAEAQLPISQLKKGLIEKSKNTDITNAITTILEASLYIDDSEHLTISDCSIKTEVFMKKMYKKNEEVGLIIVDYLQLMANSKSEKPEYQLEISNIMNDLKQLAMAVKIPILVISRMNRPTQHHKGRDELPRLSELQKNGDIETNADVVMFIHTDTNSDPNDPDAIEKQDKAEIHIAKNRNGPTGTFELVFRPEIGRFDNLMDEEDYL